MQTTPILNPAPLSAGPAPKAQQAGGAAADQPFNQVLSREVAERRNAADSGKPDAKEPAPANASSQPAATTAQKAKPADENKPAPAQPADAAPGAVDAATVQMLALAAQFGQPNAIAIPTATAPGAASEMPANAAAIGERDMAEKLATAALPHQKLLTRPDEKGALLQPSGFDPLIRPADEQGPPLALVADKPLTGLSATIQSTLDLPAARNQEKQPDLSAAALAPLQQAVFDKTQAAANNAIGKLAPQVGATGWDQALGQQMVWMVAGAQQSASLTLNPPDLGPLQVVLNVSSSQASANFIAAQPEVRQALEAALPKLREMLENAGIQLGQANVSAGTPNQHGSFGQQQQASSHHTHQAGAAEPVRAIRTAVTARHGMVDTFA